MEITIIKGAAADTIQVLRSDGSTASTSFPHKGPVPHDAVHLFVESVLGMKEAFWGMVARGRHPEEVGAIAKAAGHPSSARPMAPEPSIVQAIQAERIVECFEADLWGGGFDPQAFRDMVKTGCERSLVPGFSMDDEAIARVRRRVAAFRDQWAALQLHQSCSLVWPDDDGSDEKR